VLLYSTKTARKNTVVYLMLFPGKSLEIIARTAITKERE
jgi:hypothetical protein